MTKILVVGALSFLLGWILYKSSHEDDPLNEVYDKEEAKWHAEKQRRERETLEEDQKAAQEGYQRFKPKETPQEDSGT